MYPGEGNGNPLQYACLGNPMDRSLAGYGPWIHKRIKHDLATKQQHVPGTGQSSRHTPVNKTA